jgi:hypothetical protein
MSARERAGTGKPANFHDITQKNDYSARLREFYCVKWPKQCNIHQRRRTGGDVTITLWPRRKVV